MTAAERDRLKALVDEARRATVRCVCVYCGADFTPAKHASGLQRFCAATHRKAHWQRTTEAGREQQARYKRARRARLRAAAA